MRRLGIACVAIFLFTNVANAQQAAPMSADEIIQRVSEVYASCTSYMDEGKEEAKTSDHGGRISHRSFTTAFVRPSNFRFEETATEPRGEKRRFIAWQAGELGTVWPAARRSSSGWTGAESVYWNTMTRRPQNIVLGLLFPGRARRDTLLDLTDVKVTGEDRINNRLTFRIDGNLNELRASRDYRGFPVTVGVPLLISLWIDQQQFLILKIRQKPEGTNTITTTFKPVMNAEVSADKLAFNPPSAPTPDSGPSNVEVIKFHFFEKVQKIGTAASATYVYELTVRNLGPKKIEAVAWEQSFLDPNSNRLRRQTHFSKQSVEPNQSEVLKEEVAQGKSRVINAANTNSQNDGNQVQVSCVIYADGSWWKDPAAKQFECEYLSRLIRHDK
jgi:outer membrane lipoprotein-sorting protein